MTEIDLTEAAGASARWASRAAASFAPVGDLLTSAIVVADAGGRVTYVNRAWTQVTGQQELAWRGPGWLEPLEPAGRATTTRALLADLGAGRSHHAEWTVRTTGGDRRALAVTAAPKVGPDGDLLGFVVTASDVTAEREQLRVLAHRATHDPLTGLYNRSQFLDFVRHAIDRLPRLGHGCAAVLFIDVDGLKETNDRLGHGAGDRLLLDVADRIRSSVRPDDVIARYGGDEFTVLCEGLTEADDAFTVARRVQEAARTASGEGGPVGLSIGVATTNGSTDPDQLIAAADDAMYLAKELKPGTPVMHGGS